MKPQKKKTAFDRFLDLLGKSFPLQIAVVIIAVLFIVFGAAFVIATLVLDWHIGYDAAAALVGGDDRLIEIRNGIWDTIVNVVCGPLFTVIGIVVAVVGAKELKASRDSQGRFEPEGVKLVACFFIAAAGLLANGIWLLSKLL